MKKMFNVAVIFVLLFLFCGCSSLFIKKDTIIFLDKKIYTQNREENIIVGEYTTIANGIAWDYMESSNSILMSKDNKDISAEEAPLNLYTYNLENQNIENVFQDVKNNVEAKFDKVSNGIYYREESVDSATSRIMWADALGKRTVGLTEVKESSSLCWYLTDEGVLLYTLGDGRIYFANNKGINNIYNISTNVTIKKIRYLSKSESVIFLAQDNQTNSTILYKMPLSEDKKTLISIEINISDFEVNNDKDLIFYLKSSSSQGQSLIAYDNTTSIKRQLYKGDIERINCSPKGAYAVLYTKMTEVSPVQSLWIIPLDQDIDPVQIAVNINLVGKVLWNSNEDTIYFSTTSPEKSTNQVDQSESEIKYSLQKLEFKIKK